MQRTFLVVLLAVGGGILALADRSAASFPGVSGQLVVAENGVRTLDPDGTNSQRIWTATTPPPCFPCAFGTEAAPSWSPDGTRIAFDERVQIEIQASTHGIVSVDASGTNFRWLTQNDGSDPTIDTEPRWSPDGQTVVFERTVAGASTLAKVGATGGAVTPLTTAARSDHQPDWSPNGARIAFATGGQIHLVNADGTMELALTAGDDDADPSWSPSGNQLLFVRHQQLWVMDANGSNQRQLVDTVGVRSPAWSPDGLRIVYARCCSSPPNGTYVLDPATGSSTLVSSGLQPDWGTHPVAGAPPPPPPPPPPPAAANLSLSGSVAPTRAAVGGLVKYTLDVTNGGPSLAVGVTVTVALGSDLIQQGSESPAGPCAAGDPLVCGLGTLASGGTATVTILVQPRRAGVFTSAAAVLGAIADPDSANNQVTLELTAFVPESTTPPPKPPRCTIKGTKRADVIHGTLKADRICALGGNDRVTTIDRARDTVDCGAGRDQATVDRRDTVVHCERVRRQPYKAPKRS